MQAPTNLLDTGLCVRKTHTKDKIHTRCAGSSPAGGVKNSFTWYIMYGVIVRELVLLSPGEKPGESNAD